MRYRISAVCIFTATAWACGSSVDTGGGSGDAGAAGSMTPDASVDPDSGSTSDASAGPGSDPGFIQCGGAPCISEINYCCDEPSTNTQKCVPLSTSACGGYRISCDETADCSAGTVCCTHLSNTSFFDYSTSCQMDCGTESYPTCKSDNECNGVPCVSQVCHGATIWTCGPIPMANCQ